MLRGKLYGKKVAMVSATCYGGGVAEILHSLVPLLSDLGLDVDWFVLSGCTNQFYNVTKSFHNCLQGQKGPLEERDMEIYLHYNELNAFAMQGWHYDYYVIHDPQPAALIHYRGKRAGEKWNWRCHIDTSTPNMEYWDFLYRTLRKAGEDYDIKIVTNFNGITELEVNAFQTVADVVLQKSLTEKIGLLSCQIEDHDANPLQLHLDLCLIQPVKVRVAVGMVADLMPGRGDCPDHHRILLHPTPKRKMTRTFGAMTGFNPGACGMDQRAKVYPCGHGKHRKCTGNRFTTFWN